ncbi:MAG TPA: hypothetical protein PKC59_03600 [Burkholderiaceae bacterium]|nr:hypothetical protein [Burkholderiaceae bacterium]HMX10716.1 hypothetical protein [Burkholderiaceae bacterium]HMZ00759.1 hypothetical protein [Burkholderiaceae bacterium]HNB45416.1 hypothetical protein [Burkholderiaceae bacterium]HNG81322.1 hypothetical protein [Burkholderiaceae bacterium]
MTTLTSLFLNTAGAWIGHRLGGRGRARRSMRAEAIGFEDTVPMEVPSDFATLLPGGMPAELPESASAAAAQGSPAVESQQAMRPAEAQAALVTARPHEGDASESQEVAGVLPPPSEFLAHWSIDYDSCDGDPQPHRVYLLRVHTRLMCLMCFCELGGNLRTFSWSGIRAVRDAVTGRPIDFEAWIAAHMARQFEAEPRALHTSRVITH